MTLIDMLKSCRQYDAEGCELIVPRQAVDEFINLLEAKDAFDVAPENADWEPPHPIFKLAADNDRLHAELIEAKRKYEQICIERNRLEVENMRLNKHRGCFVITCCGVPMGVSNGTKEDADKILWELRNQHKMIEINNGKLSADITDEHYDKCFIWKIKVVFPFIDGSI